MGKKYFWLKIGEFFFESDEMIYLESLDKGDTYIKIWMKILLKCLKDKDKAEYGFLRFTDTIPYDDKLLSKLLKVDINDFRVAMKYFQELAMIQILEDKTIYIDSVQKMIGRESDSAERVRKHREKKKLIEEKCYNVTDCNVTVNANKEIEIEIEKEVEKEVEIEKNKRFIKPTHQELQDYNTEKSYNIDIEQFYDYYESKGWMVGKNKMSKWKAAMSNWKRTENKYNNKTSIKNNPLLDPIEGPEHHG